MNAPVCWSLLLDFIADFPLGISPSPGRAACRCASCPDDGMRDGLEALRGPGPGVHMLHQAEPAD